MRLNIARETFTDMMDAAGVTDLLLESYEELGTLFETTNYIFKLDPCDETAIIDKNTLDWICPIVINWYKCFCVGRCLNVTGVESIGELREILDNVKKELSDKLDSLVKI